MLFFVQLALVSRKKKMCQYRVPPLDPIEEILKQAGDWGPAQLLLLALFGVFNISAAWHYFAQTVISISPPFTCATPGPSPCFEWVNGSSTESQPCASGWTFDPQSPTTLIVETQWVCDKSWIPYFGQSAFSLGSTIGTLCLGLLADKIGRMPVLVISNTIGAVANVVTALCPTTIASYAAVRLLAGTASDSNFNMMYLLVMEYLRPSLRSVGLNLAVGVFYMVGCVSVPWISHAAGHWRFFILITASPALLLPIVPFLVPESARWALAAGKGPQAAFQSMQKIAKFNKRKLLPEDEANFIVRASRLRPNPRANILGLFCSPRLRRNTLILLFKSMVLTLCYDAISRYSVGPDPLAMLSFGSLVILPGCAVVAFMQEKVGRKLLALSALFFCAFFIAIAGGMRKVDVSHSYSISMALLGRFAVVVAYNSGAQYTAELVPAQVQAGGVAAIHVAGYAASILSPQVLYLEQLYPSLPELVLGILAALGAVLCLFLPETSHKALPVTLEEGEEFGRGESYLPCTPCGVNRRLSETDLVDDK
ncbi:solute carrier family 22 member 13-like isoform X2 [Neocloeon triangulifer]|uniref:solute carrier family 22 member 13-like isoform X2 n=1 Tax=Neocloeon triangulifer TaxID=2078957 RepID=UPI00286ED12D|nr:solute carrier family 22 member 13-like isoform X2 [Neocloeon triangulifer]